MLETKEDSSLKNTSMFWISDLMLLWSSRIHTMNDNIILCWLRMMWDMPCWTKSDHTLPMRMTYMQWHISWSIIYYLSVCNNNINPALNHTSSAGDDAMPPTAGAQELQAKAAAGAPQQPQEPRKPSSRQNAWQWQGAEPFNEMSPPFPTIQKKTRKEGLKAATQRLKWTLKEKRPANSASIKSAAPRDLLEVKGWAMARRC